MKNVFFLLLCICLSMFLGGCQIRHLQEKEHQPLDYTVLDLEEIPQELKELIEKNRACEIRMKYADQGSLYMIRGYGEQKTGGYSISVKEVYLDEQGIHVDTSLIGPTAEENATSEEPSYPYLVLKMEQREEEVFFE